MSAGRLTELSETIGRSVSRETLARLESFERLFGDWASQINLAAPSTHNQVWRRHILDSAQILPLAGDAEAWLDLGSGGGFPGIVVACLLADDPKTHVQLVESNKKKTAFLRLAAHQCGTRAVVSNSRIESASTLVKLTPEVVTARALAPLKALLGLAAPWLEAGSRGLFHKGRDYRAEIAEARDAWQFDLIEHPSKVDSESVILEIAGLKPVYLR